MYLILTKRQFLSSDYFDISVFLFMNYLVFEMKKKNKLQYNWALTANTLHGLFVSKRIEWNTYANS